MRRPGRLPRDFPHTILTLRAMPPVRTSEAEIDRLARTMAASAGVVWDRLDHYPGYIRTYWRGEARALLDRLATGDLSKVA